MNPRHVEFECTSSCRSSVHGGAITSALTKRAVQDAALASFVRCVCRNYLRALDDHGRSALHMAASRGRIALLEWLIKHFPSNQQGPSLIDWKDSESGYTALHRSIFYGQLHAAVSLIKLGSNVSILDNENISAIDLALLDRHPRFELSKSLPCEVYSWGNNNNYTLGVSSQHQRNFPEPLSAFTKLGVHIKQVCLGKFHSVFVGSCGTVWSCGHGEGGRLGLGKSDTRVLPTQVNLPESCVSAAVGRDHTLILLQSGTILSCGLNEHHQLGQIPPPVLQLSPRPVKLRLSGTLGVHAARYHSVAYNCRAVYSWGLNGGQLGHPKENEKTIIIPKKVLGIGSGKDDCKIELVAVSDGATVASTSKGDIYILYQYQVKRIAFRQHGIKSIHVVGGEVVGGDKLTEQQKAISVLMLNSVGNIYLWQESSNQFVRCVFNLNRPIFVMEAILTREFIMITTKIGEAFQGNIIPRKTTTVKLRTDESPQSPKEKGPNHKNFNNFIDKDDCYLVKLKKISNVQRAVDIFCDSKANNFSVLQVVPNACLLDVPLTTSSQLKEDFLKLLDDASEMDLLHDVVIKVDKNIFPAHQYMISVGSEYFNKLCIEHDKKSEKLEIIIENIHPIIFKQILNYLYTGTCELLVPGPCHIKILDDKKKEESNDASEKFIINEEMSAFEVYKNQSKNKKIKNKTNTRKDEYKMFIDPVRHLQWAAKKLGINTLYKLLDQYVWSNGNIIIKDNNRKNVEIKYEFDRNILSDLWDVQIKCSKDVIINAHKCVLAARLEYFEGMFCHSWAESTTYSTISLPINSEMLNPIINFLYNDKCPELRNCEDFEYIGNMLVICDQLFITRMREMCEVALSNMLTLKNVSDILQISDTYNCPQLKKCCMEYISLNLSTLLEMRSLEGVPQNILRDVTNYYLNFNPKMNQRIITPFSDCATDEEINSCMDIIPTDIDETVDDETLKEIEREFSSVGRKKNKTRKNSQTEESEKADSKSTNFLIEHYNNNSSERNEKNVESQDDSWTKVSTTSKQQRIIQGRLKAVVSAKENIDLINTSSESFTKLVKDDSMNNMKCSSPLQSPNSSMNISNDDSIEELYSRSPQTSLNITFVKAKLSQKQRKKLISESKETCNSSIDSEIKTDDIVEKNPWKKVENIQVTNVQSPTSSSNVKFMDILEDQRKQRENLTKMMTKSLLLTQIEDKAIEELTKLYLSNNGDDERIIVRRVPCFQIAAPQWINKSFKSTS